MNVLVVGGAGYVGSHAARRLKAAGHHPVIFDNLGLGHREVAGILGVPLVVADLADGRAIETALTEYSIDVVMHFAAFALVGESMTHSQAYYRNNVALTIELLDAMERAGVKRLVFSSTCAIYGEPTAVPITESEKKAPMSPYGRSKLMAEQILADYLHSHPDFAFAALRYFNASGAATDGSLGEDHDPETHLIPLVLQTALGQRPFLTIYGTDYPTPDGTAVRDYVHVDDLAEAHLLAMTRLKAGEAIQCNLGTGRGFSVQEIVDACRKVTGRTITVRNGSRREGDPPALFADARRAKELLGWEAKHTDPEEIIASAWRWHSAHPDGYADGRKV